ncbi:MAG: hypothetical protein KIT79_04495 [Deltaproteobacteria bacterium]|nr:hypothetical protein [Deltaproteobacteria bacterium]
MAESTHKSSSTPVFRGWVLDILARVLSTPVASELAITELKKSLGIPIMNTIKLGVAGLPAQFQPSAFYAEPDSNPGCSEPK